MAISAQYIPKWEGHAVAGFEYVLRMRFTLDGDPVDITSYDLAFVATSKLDASLHEVMPTTVTGDDNDILEVLTETSVDAGLELTDGTATGLFLINVTRAGEVGRKLIGRIEETIDASSTEKPYDEQGSSNRETLVCNLITTNEEIEAELEDYTLTFMSALANTYARAFADTYNTTGIKATSLATGSRPKMIIVTADETNEGAKTRYYYEGVPGELDITV